MRGQPVVIERRINYTMLAGGMIEAIRIGHDPDMPQVAEENQGTNFTSSSGLAGAKRDQSVRALPRSKLDAYRLECAPNKSRAIERGRSLRPMNNARRVADRSPLTSIVEISPKRAWATAAMQP